MNDLLLEYILQNLEVDTEKEKKIEISFLDKYGAGITAEDNLISKLISTDEEGNDYSKM